MKYNPNDINSAIEFSAPNRSVHNPYNAHRGIQEGQTEHLQGLSRALGYDVESPTGGLEMVQRQHDERARRLAPAYGIGRNPWENSDTGNAPTIRQAPVYGDVRKRLNGDSAVSNLLAADEPVPMGQAGTKEQRQAIDMEPWFPPADPRNNPDVIDPVSPQRRLYDTSPPSSAIDRDGKQLSNNNPFQGMGQGQLQTLMEQLQAMLGGGANSNGSVMSPPWRPTGGAGPTRPGELSNAELIGLGLEGQRPTRPQTGMESGVEPPDYVDDVRPPYQRPMPSYETRSDRRLKSNIVRIGTHPQHGIGIYDYDIDGHRDTGVMAQELLSVLPSAVSVGDDGFLRVDYSAL